MSERKTDRTLSVYKSSSMKSFREPPLIVSFALATYIPLPLTLVLLRQIKQQSCIASVLEPTPDEQMKKMFDIVELGRAESNNPAQLPRTT